jgi:hypothetical protein
MSFHLFPSSFGFGLFSENFKTGSECLLKKDPRKFEFFGFEKEKKLFFFLNVASDLSVCL